MRMTIVIFVLVSAACYAIGCTTAKTIQNPDGSEAHLISCLDEMFCNEKAADICDGSYKVMRTIKNWDTTKDQILVKCENSNGRKIVR